MNSIILFGSFAFLLAFNIPIAVSLGLSAMVALFMAELPAEMIPINVYAASSKFALMAIPFFIIAGNVMERSGISERLILLAQRMVGHYRNGVAMVCVIVSCFFAAISGSGPATVAALGIILIPAMIRAGYRLPFATALMAAGGAIGVIIPPSVTFIVFGSISGASIGKLFMAGVIPGILMGIALILVTIFLTRKDEGIKPMPRATGAERWSAFKDAFWGLMMPVIILGGIYSGIFTPTEAAAVSAVYGLIVGMFIYRRLSWSELPTLFIRSASQTGVVMYVIICASLFAWVVTVDGIAMDIGDWLNDLTQGNLYLFLLITNLILLAAGCVMDAVSAIYIFTPILLPVALKLGYDITAFGILLCVNLAIGLVTPPVGVNLFTACSISKISIKDLFGDVFPILVALLVVLALVTYFPAVSMAIPNLLGAK
ncbi:TRAP transporter large permease [uncultured Cohaesibacter sp.]|uniref:TRAP transporter large permease n=1 Tax=uncultured Cohaesibacter sp. TaxID=1002546 RepID=UPI0029C94FC1|nr:TRAP transporter large permease [uncultured Cohaesibacter sp.]